MRVSVIIPLYNKAAYIERTLESITAQTFCDYEVLVVDDGSTDGSGEIVAARNDPRVRLIRQANAGPGAARNRGLAEARGELVAFLDADDEWLPTYLEKGIALLDRYGPEVATATSGYIEHPSGHSTEAFWRQRGLIDGLYRLTPDSSPAFAVHLLAYMGPWSTIARTEIVRRLGGFFDEYRCLYAEDAFLFLQVLLGFTIAVSLEPLTRFHREASELSQRGKLRPIEPMLTHADAIRATCPAPMRGLLEAILTHRAVKTACVLGYWGRWREARSLLKTFAGRRAWGLPLYWPALICASPLAPPLSSVVRRLHATRATRPSSPS